MGIVGGAIGGNKGGIMIIIGGELAILNLITPIGLVGQVLLVIGGIFTLKEKQISRPTATPL
jgi:hypothetical protein